MSLDESSKDGLVVMIVDDDEVDQMIYQRVFSRTSAFKTVIGCTLAHEALERLRKLEGKTIDLLFLDINMPGMNGFEFLEVATQELGEQLDKTAVVMLTTSLDDSDKRRVRQFPQVRAYLTKPLTVQALDALIQDLAL